MLALLVCFNNMASRYKVESRFREVKLQWNKSKGIDFWFELSGVLRNQLSHHSNHFSNHFQLLIFNKHCSQINRKQFITIEHENPNQLKTVDPNSTNGWKSVLFDCCDIFIWCYNVLAHGNSEPSDISQYGMFKSNLARDEKGIRFCPGISPRFQTKIPNFKPFQAKMAKNLYPISDKPCPVWDQNVQNLYPFSDQNGSEIIPFRAHTCIDPIHKWPPSNFFHD